MVKAVLTPAHPHPLKALLNEPFARTFDHAAAQRQSQRLVRLIVHMIAVPSQVRIDHRQDCAIVSSANIRRKIYGVSASIDRVPATILTV